MFKYIFFLLLPFSIFYISKYAYKNCNNKCFRLWVQIALLESRRRFFAKLLCILMAANFFLSVAVFPGQLCVALSLIPVFCFSSVSSTLRVLRIFRNSFRWYKRLVYATFFLSAFHFTFSLSVQLALMLLFSTFYPSDESLEFYRLHKDDSDFQTKFVNVYFG